MSRCPPLSLTHTQRHETRRGTGKRRLTGRGRVTREGHGYVNTIKYIKCTYENIKEFIKKILWKRAQSPLPDHRTKTIAILAGCPYCHPLTILRGVNETCWYSPGSVLLIETSPSMVVSVKYLPTVPWDFPVNSCTCSHLHIELVCSPYPQPDPSLSVVMIQVLILSSHWNFQWVAAQSSKKTWGSFLFLSFEELDYCLTKSLENPFLGEGLQNSGSWGRVTTI